MKIMKSNKKGFIQLAVPTAVLIALGILIIAGIAYAADALSDNGNGFYNLFYEDVKSGTEVAPGCDPIEYITKFEGTLDLVSLQKGFFTFDYRIEIADVHISDIFFDQNKLGAFSDKFESSICLYDVLDGGDEWIQHQKDCVEIEGKVSKNLAGPVEIEEFPFTLKYNLYDNDCNGQVDDHTFNLIAKVQTEDGFESLEKTVAIVNGEAVFQNVKY